MSQLSYTLSADPEAAVSDRGQPSLDIRRKKSVIAVLNQGDSDGLPKATIHTRFTPQLINQRLTKACASAKKPLVSDSCVMVAIVKRSMNP
ncbi:TPA: hypothetical protein ACW72W_001624 [Aeromonas veronii]